MTSRRDKEQLEKLSNSLFGAPEDLSFEDVLETLKSADINSEAICDRAYRHLLLRARDYRARQEEVPARLRKALEDLRPASAEPRSQDELDRSASATLSRVLDAVRSRVPRPMISNLATSYRNKKVDESPKDQSIIKDLEKELLEDLSEEDKTD
jgi:hypothetical protein